MSGLAALVVDAFVRRKPMITSGSTWLSTCLQLWYWWFGYRAAGVRVGYKHFQFGFLPFVALVVTFLRYQPK